MATLRRGKEMSATASVCRKESTGARISVKDPRERISVRVAVRNRNVQDKLRSIRAVLRAERAAHSANIGRIQEYCLDGFAMLYESAPQFRGSRIREGDPAFNIVSHPVAVRI